MADQCFVCGAANSQGLRIKFRLDDEVCRAEFTPPAHLVGYDGVTHGGILFSLLDDVMANSLWLRGERAFTARCDIRYRAPLPAETAVRMEGRIVKRRGRLAVTEGRILRMDDGALVAEASAHFMCEV